MTGIIESIKDKPINTTLIDPDNTIVVALDLDDTLIAMHRPCAGGSTQCYPLFDEEHFKENVAEWTELADRNGKKILFMIVTAREHVLGDPIIPQIIEITGGSWMIINEGEDDNAALRQADLGGPIGYGTFSGSKGNISACPQSCAAHDFRVIQVGIAKNNDETVLTYHKNQKSRPELCVTNINATNHHSKKVFFEIFSELTTIPVENIIFVDDNPVYLNQAEHLGTVTISATAVALARKKHCTGFTEDELGKVKQVAKAMWDTLGAEIYQLCTNQTNCIPPLFEELAALDEHDKLLVRLLSIALCSWSILSNFIQYYRNVSTPKEVLDLEKKVRDSVFKGITADHVAIFRQSILQIGDNAITQQFIEYFIDTHFCIKIYSHLSMLPDLVVQLLYDEEAHDRVIQQLRSKIIADLKALLNPFSQSIIAIIQGLPKTLIKKEDLAQILKSWQSTTFHYNAVKRRPLNAMHQHSGTFFAHASPFNKQADNCSELETPKVTLNDDGASPSKRQKNN